MGLSMATAVVWIAISNLVGAGVFNNKPINPDNHQKVFAGVFLPIADAWRGHDCGRLENITDTFQKLSNSHHLGASVGTECFLYMIIFFMAVFTVLREGSSYGLIMLSTSTEKAVWDMFRGGITWLTDLCIYYGGGSKLIPPLGEDINVNTIFLLLGYSVAVFGLYLFYMQPYRRKTGHNEAAFHISPETAPILTSVTTCLLKITAFFAVTRHALVKLNFMSVDSEFFSMGLSLVLAVLLVARYFVFYFCI
jgi:hypothetical protein